MSVAERAARTPLAGEQRELSGWGRTASSRARVLRPRAGEDVADFLASQARPERGVIARGAARNYGDAAQNEGGDVLDMTGLDEILSIDAERRAGESAGGRDGRSADGAAREPQADAAGRAGHAARHDRRRDRQRHPRQEPPPRRRDGAARPVDVDLHARRAAWPRSRPRAIPGSSTPRSAEWASPGVVVEATLAAEPLASPWVAADIDRTDGLAQTLELLAAEERHRYSVAWLDLLAAGPRMGRAVISQADPLPGEAATPRRTRRRARVVSRNPDPWPPLIDVPRGFPGVLLRPSTVRAFNALHWNTSPRRERGRPLAYAPYFFPLDVLGEWNRLYGAAGLIQYQFVIPAGAEADAGALLRADSQKAAARIPSRFQALRRGLRRAAVVSARGLDARHRPAGRGAGSGSGAR